MLPSKAHRVAVDLAGKELIVEDDHAADGFEREESELLISKATVVSKKKINWLLMREKIRVAICQNTQNFWAIFANFLIRLDMTFSFNIYFM